MAKVEMDMTEYEALKKVETVLRDSLEREKELALRIDQLNAEKIEVLEGNNKVVTIVEIKRTSETVLSYHSDVTILNRLKYALDPRTRSGHHYDTPIDSPFGLTSLLDTFFEKKTHEFEVEKSVHTKGFDQVKIEIRKDLEERLVDDVKESLNSLQELRKEAHSWSKDNGKLQGKINVLEKEVTTLVGVLGAKDKSLERLGERVTKLEKYKTVIESIKSMPANIIITSSRFKSNILKLIQIKE